MLFEDTTQQRLQGNGLDGFMLPARKRMNGLPIFYVRVETT